MTTSPAAREPGPGSFVDRLRIGESLPVPDDSLVTWDISPLHAERRVKPLLDPVRPDLRVHINKWGAGAELSIRDGLLAGVPDENEAAPTAESPQRSLPTGERRTRCDHD